MFFVFVAAFPTRLTDAHSNMDMIQAIGWNSLERTASDWKRLFELVDKRLRYVGTSTPPGSAVSIIEARFWLGDSGPHGTA